jgi:hypothetical protein
MLAWWWWRRTLWLMGWFCGAGSLWFRPSYVWALSSWWSSHNGSLLGWQMSRLFETRLSSADGPNSCCLAFALPCVSLGHWKLWRSAAWISIYTYQENTVCYKPSIAQRLFDQHSCSCDLLPFLYAS